MRMICYRKPLCSEEETIILDRAAHRKHLFKKMILWDILLFASVGILGPLLHYASGLFPAFPVLQLIAPVNESIWEHQKLLFFPAILVGIIRRLCTGRLQHGILTTFMEGILLSIVLCIAGFYTYSGILGTHILTADKILFYCCALFQTVYIHKRSSGQKKSSLPGLVLMFLLAGCFFYFTWNPPTIGLFTDLSQPVQ